MSATSRRIPPRDLSPPLALHAGETLVQTRLGRQGALGWCTISVTWKNGFASEEKPLRLREEVMSQRVWKLQARQIWVLIQDIQVSLFDIGSCFGIAVFAYFCLLSLGTRKTILTDESKTKKPSDEAGAPLKSPRHNSYFALLLGATHEESRARWLLQRSWFSEFGGGHFWGPTSFFVSFCIFSWMTFSFWKSRLISRSGHIISALCSMLSLRERLTDGCLPVRSSITVTTMGRVLPWAMQGRWQERPASCSAIQTTRSPTGKEDVERTTFQWGCWEGKLWMGRTRVLQDWAGWNVGCCRQDCSCSFQDVYTPGQAAFYIFWLVSCSLFWAFQLVDPNGCGSNPKVPRFRDAYHHAVVFLQGFNWVCTRAPAWPTPKSECVGSMILLGWDLEIGTIKSPSWPPRNSHSKKESGMSWMSWVFLDDKAKQEAIYFSSLCFEVAGDL